MHDSSPTQTGPEKPVGHWQKNSLDEGSLKRKQTPPLRQGEGLQGSAVVTKVLSRDVQSYR